MDSPRMGNDYEDIESGSLENTGSLNIITRMRRRLRATKKRNFVNQHMARIGQMRLWGIIKDPLASVLFQKYILNEDSENEKEMRMYWNCIKMSKDILWNVKLLNDEVITNRLMRYSPTTYWEQEILMLSNMSFDNRKSKHICFKIYEFMIECEIKMEFNPEYHNFLSDIRIRREKVRKYLEEIYDDKTYFQMHGIEIDF